MTAMEPECTSRPSLLVNDHIPRFREGAGRMCLLLKNGGHTLNGAVSTRGYLASLGAFRERPHLGNPIALWLSGHGSTFVNTISLERGGNP